MRRHCNRLQPHIHTNTKSKHVSYATLLRRCRIEKSVFSFRMIQQLRIYQWISLGSWAVVRYICRWRRWCCWWRYFIPSANDLVVIVDYDESIRIIVFSTSCKDDNTESMKSENGADDLALYNQLSDKGKVLTICSLFRLICDNFYSFFSVHKLFDGFLCHTTRIIIKMNNLHNI